jgi:phosphatidate phosphatase APP1
LEGRYRIAVISDIDDCLFSATVGQLVVEFDVVVTAQQARCY